MPVLSGAFIRTSTLTGLTPKHWLKNLDPTNPFKGRRGPLVRMLLCKIWKFYMAVLALNVKMTDPLVVAAELSERNYPGKCSREVWGPSEIHFSSVWARSVKDS